MKTLRFISGVLVLVAVLASPNWRAQPIHRMALPSLPQAAEA